MRDTHGTSVQDGTHGGHAAFMTGGRCYIYILQAPTPAIIRIYMLYNYTLYKHEPVCFLSHKRTVTQTGVCARSCQGCHTCFAHTSPRGGKRPVFCCSCVFVPNSSRLTASQLRFCTSLQPRHLFSVCRDPVCNVFENVDSITHTHTSAHTLVRVEKEGIGVTYYQWET